MGASGAGYLKKYNDRLKLIRKLISEGSLKESDVVEQHCIHPSFLIEQLNKSLQNVGIECLDLVYLENSEEISAPVLK